jgi:hypothetical protein
MPRRSANASFVSRMACWRRHAVRPVQVSTTSTVGLPCSWRSGLAGWRRGHVAAVSGRARYGVVVSGELSFCRARVGRWLDGMPRLPALAAPPLGDRLRPRVTPPEQVTHFSPRASHVKPLHGGSLDRVQGLVACRQLLARYEGGTALLDEIFDGCDLGDLRLQEFGERICHEVRVGGETPLLNRVLTDPQRRFNMVLKPRALHSLKPHAPLHRCSQMKTGRTPRLHSQAGPDHQVL